MATSAPDLSEPFRTRDGAGLHVEIDGPPQAGVTVVLLHGWTLDARLWAPVSAALRHTDGLPPPRVLRYDLRGHGRSDAVDAPTMTLENLADDLAELIEAFAPAGPVVLGGHSMGGMTIMALAQRHPALVAERVAGVALVATAAGGMAETTYGLHPRLAQLVRAGERRVYGSALFTRRTALSRYPRLIQPGMRWLLLGTGAGRVALDLTTTCVAGCRPATIAGFRPAMDVHDRDGSLAAFATVPTAVLVGTRDRLTPETQARRIVAALPSAELTIFPEAGHMLPVERVSGVTARLAKLVSAA